MEEDKEQSDITAYLEMLGSFLANIDKSEDQKFIPGEIAVFFGTKDKRTGKGIKYVFGANANPDFKERMCDAAMDILLNDESIKLSEKFKFVDDQIDEDIDLEI